MLAIETVSFGGPEVLRPVERPTPEIRPEEVLIEVKAAGVARADTLQRRGKYPPPPGAPDIPGLDVAGRVAAIGAAVKGFAPGNRVCAILAGGGYAEFCAVPALQVLPTPANWSDEEAASLPENLFTVYDNLVTRAGLKCGDTVLIHGGTSGIGSMGLMLAKFLGARSIATVGSKEKCEAAIRIGAHHAINYREQDFVTEVGDLTRGRGADVVLDMVGGSYLERNLNALAVEGRIVIVATQGGRTGELDIGKLMHKRGRVIGSTMRARTPEEKGRVARALSEAVWPSLPARDPIRPVIDSTFPLRDAAQAHRRMESGEHIGKIVLVV